jgi:hypothetical protein
MFMSSRVHSPVSPPGPKRTDDVVLEVSSSLVREHDSGGASPRTSEYMIV